jgi:hypothetical protein
MSNLFLDNLMELNKVTTNMHIWNVDNHKYTGLQLWHPEKDTFRVIQNSDYKTVLNNDNNWGLAFRFFMLQNTKLLHIPFAFSTAYGLPGNFLPWSIKIKTRPKLNRALICFAFKQPAKTLAMLKAQFISNFTHR